MTTSATFKWNQTTLNRVRQSFTKGMLNMGYDIANRAKANAPVDTGALKLSIRTTLDGNDKVYVVAGGTHAGIRVPYALKREYENHLHPGTRMYMHKAFDSVVRGDVGRYFRGFGG